jgi:hypothetical protein
MVLTGAMLACSPYNEPCREQGSLATLALQLDSENAAPSQHRDLEGTTFRTARPRGGINILIVHITY